MKKLNEFTFYKTSDIPMLVDLRAYMESDLHTTLDDVEELIFSQDVEGLPPIDNWRINKPLPTIQITVKLKNGDTHNLVYNYESDIDILIKKTEEEN